MVRQAFLDGMSKVVSSVSAVTTDGTAGPHGVTVSSMTSVSADPPMLLVCIHHASPTCDAIRKNGVFCVNLLHADQRNISEVLAGRALEPDPAAADGAGKAVDKFATGNWRPGATGAPRLADAVATFGCRLVAVHRAGSHFVFIGQVAETIDNGGLPLLYGNRAYTVLDQGRAGNVGSCKD